MSKGSVNLNINVNIDLAEIVSQISKGIGKVLYKKNFSKQNVGGGVFVSSMTGDYVVAAYYHPSKSHSATADGGTLGGGVAKSTASKGRWAVAYSSQGIANRKTYYSTS